MRRWTSRSGKRLPPTLFYLPGDGEGHWPPLPKRQTAPSPAPRVELVRTGSLFHLFVDLAYVDTYLDPDISDLWRKQLDLPRLAEARAALHV